MKKVSIIILNFNGKDYILDCLKSVKELITTNLELQLVIVDNASTDGSSELIKKFASRSCKIIQNEKNLGYTGGNNVGIKYATENGSDYVMLLNSDTIVDKNLLISTIEVMEGDQAIGVLGTKIYFFPGKEYHQNRYEEKDRGKVFWYAGGKIDWQNLILTHRGVDEVDNGQYDKQIETDFITGCCLLTKREVLEKIGALDDRYYLYLEDADLSQRIKLAGYRLVYSPVAKLWHINAGSSSIGGNLHDYFITRNRMFFGIKYASLRTKAALLKQGIKLLLTGRSWQKIGIRDFFLGRFGKGSWNK